MSQPPNIVYVFTDQQPADALSAAGNPHLHTPNMDRLAAAGVRFTRAYCAFPLCAPSRASMWSGRTPSEVGITGNGGQIPEAMRPQTLGRLLQGAGYRCLYGGKWHAGSPGCGPPYEGMGFETLCLQSDDLLPEVCERFLREQASGSQPFFLVASFDNPHNICEWSRDTPLPWGEVEVGPPGECPELPANYAIAPYEPEVVTRCRDAQPYVNRDAFYDPDRWRQHRAAVCRLVEKVDRQIGRILDALEASGLAERTLVVFASDHGEMAGAHRLAQKSVHYEEAVRVPLIICPPGGAARAGETDGRLASIGLDLLPTLCDYAGVPVPEGLPGRSLRPLVEGGAGELWREALVLQNAVEGASAAAAGRIVVTERYKYALYAWGRYNEQLYDLNEDPGEMVNLAVSVRHRDRLDAMRRLLADWCVARGDAFGEHPTRRGHAGIPGLGWVPLRRERQSQAT